MRGRSTSDASTSRGSRRDWWGVALDAPDARELARFYATLLGWEIAGEEPAWATIGPTDGVAYLAFQTSPGYERPVWPAADGAQQMMMHLDFQVDDLDAAVAHAVDLGAQEARVPTAGRRAGAARPGRPSVLPLPGHGVLTCPNLHHPQSISPVVRRRRSRSTWRGTMAAGAAGRTSGRRSRCTPPTRTRSSSARARASTTRRRSSTCSAATSGRCCSTPGPTSNPADFPLRATVDAILEGWLAEHPRQHYELVVVHSHGHGDHVAADGQLADRPDTTVVAPDLPSVQAFFGFTAWPQEVVRLDLGGRVLEVTGCPGHHPASIAVLDPWSGFLLTGDTVYPGRLYVDDMPAFVASLDRLVDLAGSRRVTRGDGVPHRDEPDAGAGLPEGVDLAAGRGSPADERRPARGRQGRRPRGGRPAGSPRARRRHHLQRPVSRGDGPPDASTLVVHPAPPDALTDNDIRALTRRHRPRRAVRPCAGCGW